MRQSASPPPSTHPAPAPTLRLATTILALNMLLAFSTAPATVTAERLPTLMALATPIPTLSLAHSPTEIANTTLTHLPGRPVSMANQNMIETLGVVRGEGVMKDAQEAQNIASGQQPYYNAPAAEKKAAAKPGMIAVYVICGIFVLALTFAVVKALMYRSRHGGYWW